MISVVVAMDKEVSELIPLIKDKKEINLCNKKVFEGKLFNKEVSIIISGIGKVNAAFSTQVVIDRYSPKYVFNFGSVGSVNPLIGVKDYFLVEKCAQFDFDLREIDPVPLGYIQDYNTVFFNTYTPKTCSHFKKVTLGTSDKFTSDKNVISEVIKMGCDIRDMEGGAIAQVCTSNNVKLIILKGVTDVYGLGTDGEQFLKNLSEISKGFPQAIEQIFNIL